MICGMLLTCDLIYPVHNFLIKIYLMQDATIQNN
jgi:hypothetical protein